MFIVTDMKKWMDRIAFHNSSGIEMGNIWSKDNNLSQITSDFAKLVEAIEFDTIGAIETKGIIYGSALSERLNLPLIVFRKKGRIGNRVSLSSHQFMNWRGEPDGLEIENDLLDAPRKILVVDDLADRLNSFGAVASLVEPSRSRIEAFLCFANISGREDIMGKKILSLIQG